ncbi:protein bric-a-brac 1-like [Adelges cooleyi]|uniref:protein bric-a-brac 1-like n=1 Tax=Adelges cooleyi TaxID=133065 RepID=UPI00217F2371|nr:protein bric-a-brac 1-like [Adelges cooleyi]XP_050421217.1 protein bric-a-brac 1-like [Adelges cooleyi]XP_050421218.1 protein bric-a-brac 1-like [Adelges cooleyi]
MSTEESQQFCLRWHNYQSSLMSTLPQLLNHDDLTDVTLCAGLRTLKAHRVVLSACSDYFKQLFKTLTKDLGASHHPVIVLPGVEFTDLCALVTFMYSGEVNVYEHQLASMLSMADTLHIKGLAEFSNVPGYTPGTFEKTSRWKRSRVDEPEAPRVNRPTLSETEAFADLDVAQDLSKRVPENENQGDAVNLVANTDQKPSTSEINVSYGEEAPTPTDLVQGPVVQGSQSDNVKSRTPVSKLYTMCFICGKQLSNHYNLRVHMETHQNAQYACSVCSHVSRSRDALRKHVSYRHPRPTNNNTTTDNSVTVDSSPNVNKLPST